MPPALCWDLNADCRIGGSEYRRVLAEPFLTRRLTKHYPGRFERVTLKQNNLMPVSPSRTPRPFTPMTLALIAALLLLSIVVFSASARVNPAAAGTCGLDITIYGGGSVQITAATMPTSEARYVNNHVDVPCGETVSATAVARDGWRFVGWQGDGVEEQDVQVTAVGGQSLVARFELQNVLVEELAQPVMGRNGNLTTSRATLVTPAASQSSPQPNAVSAAPVIDVWYGDTQSFGQLGTPQDWINILGNVSDADGGEITLSYTLNGGSSRALEVGSDGRRLYDDGDFNIDLDKDDLNNGANTVVITARDAQGNTTLKTVTVNYNSTTTWPLPYSIDWSTAASVQAVSQVVDGDWTIDNGADGLRPIQIAYDRLVAVGDLTWTDYEITVPVTVNALDPGAYNPISIAPAIGVVMRWHGHTDTPLACDQPKCGWLPTGMSSWYDWETNDEGLLLWGTNNVSKKDTSGFRITEGQTYLWKVRAETPPGQRGQFSVKVWPASGTEPANWMVTAVGGNSSLTDGSLLLLAHHVDVTFGDVTITPLSTGPDDTPPTITNLDVTPHPDGATISWQTDEPATSRVDYGPTAVYGSTATDNALKTVHRIYLTDLDPNQTFHFQVSSTDGSSNAASLPDDTFTTQPLQTITSDDFNSCALDGVWTFVNPLADGTLAVDGTTAVLTVPAGTNHDIWPETGLPTNRAPRIMQSVTEVDGLDVKFESGVSSDIQMQGVVIEESADTFLRANVQYQAGVTKLYVIGFDGGLSPKILTSPQIAPGAVAGPVHLRVLRDGGQWQVWYSFDGDNWLGTNWLHFPLSVTSVGVFAGNANDPEPAHTAVVDYVFDGYNPIDPEDGTALKLPVSVTGSGSVTQQPTCGNPVTLTAVPDAGWRFSEWQGAPLDGNTNPEVTTAFGVGDAVTAVFVPATGSRYTLTVDIMSNGTGTGGTVQVSPDQADYAAGTVVDLLAVPNAGWAFTGWAGDAAGSSAATSISMDADATVVAIFTQLKYTLTIDVVGSGQVTVSPEQADYAYDTAVTVTAVADAGWQFVGWSGALNSTAVTETITMRDTYQLTAAFEPIPPAGGELFLPLVTRP